MLDINFPYFPELFTERLRLREVTSEDLPALLQLRSNPDVLRYLDREPLESLADAEALLQTLMDDYAMGIGITWAICTPTDPTLIGNIGIWRFDLKNHRGEIGYMLLPEYHRQGYASEVLPAVLAYAFHNMSFHSLQANINPENQASRRLLERCGFIREAYFRENYFFRGQFLDSEIFSLLAHEFRP